MKILFANYSIAIVNKITIFRGLNVKFAGERKSLNEFIDNNSILVKIDKK